MKRLKIGVTQRVEYLEDVNERRDSLDVRLANLLWESGYLPVAISSGIADKKNYLTNLDVSGYVISGGNDLGASPERDDIELQILDLAKEQHAPILGICRGMQFLNFYQGGTLSKISGHVSTKHKLSSKEAEFDGRVVNSYHNYAIYERDLGMNLDILGWSPDGCIEAIRHIKQNWYGIMWHPERDKNLCISDRRLIKKIFG